MEYYSAIKKDEVLTYTATWINLENIMLSERQTQKAKYWFHLYEVLRTGKSTETDSRLRLARTGGGSKQISFSFSFWHKMF